MIKIFLSLFVFVGCLVAEQPIAVISSVKPATDPRYGNALHEIICKALLQAKKSIRIFNYSAYDPRVIEALNKQALEGIDIGLVIDKAHLPSPGVLHSNIKVFT